MYTLQLWFLLGLAGAFGALSRFALTLGLSRGFGVGLPYATLAVNVIGCLGAGMVWAALERYQIMDSHLRLVLLVGFFGALTTFSTFALENLKLLQSGEWSIIAGYLVLSLIGGIGLCFLGFTLGSATHG